MRADNQSHRSQMSALGQKRKGSVRTIYSAIGSITDTHQDRFGGRRLRGTVFFYLISLMISRRRNSRSTGRSSFDNLIEAKNP